jgi:hypothetical protein
MRIMAFYYGYGDVRAEAQLPQERLVERAR